MNDFGIKAYFFIQMYLTLVITAILKTKIVKLKMSQIYATLILIFDRIQFSCSNANCFVIILLENEVFDYYNC